MAADMMAVATSCAHNCRAGVCCANSTACGSGAPAHPAATAVDKSSGRNNFQLLTAVSQLTEKVVAP